MNPFSNRQPIFLYAMIFALCVSTVFSQPQKLVEKASSITLLSSNRDDIHRLYGTPAILNDSPQEIFEFGHTTLYVHYSLGTCAETKHPNGWDVQRETVISMFFDFTKPIEVGALDLTTKKGFVKFRIRDSVDAWSFENDELGIRYVLKTNGKIESVSIYPKKSEDSRHCDAVLRKVLSTLESNRFQASRSSISASDEKFVPPCLIRLSNNQNF
ncbi:MAG: hypothetical protein ABL984_19845 [Pyrinomonadaceae bacterium]